MKPRPALVIHGGTGTRPARRRVAQIRRHLRTLAAEMYDRLGCESALETVAFAVQRLEDDPLFNAGTGSAIQRDGHVRMSASIMDGARRRFAGVLNIERIRHPIRVAQLLMDDEDRLLAGAGAFRFARSRGCAPWNPITAARHRQWEHRRAEPSYGTVGAVALDGDGRLAAATSTGGKGFERVGRVSDSGLPAGNYATTEVAISCTGHGEDIVEEALAARIAQRVLDGHPLRRAFAHIFRELTTRHRRAGAIGIDRHGRWTWATTLPIVFAVAQSRAGHVESF